MHVGLKLVCRITGVRVVKDDRPLVNGTSGTATQACVRSSECGSRDVWPRALDHGCERVRPEV
eukprot:1772217-Alexandrium_andersonii.AAC.1